MRKAIAGISIFLFIAAIALPVFAQSPPAPTGLSATATSAQSATISWDAMPADGCSGDVNYYMYVSINGYYIISVYAGVNATSYDLNSLDAGTYKIEMYSYCYASSEWSASVATTSVVIDSNNTGQAPPIADDSLGVVTPSGLSVSENAGVVTVTWDNVIGEVPPQGYCDVSEYYVAITDYSYATQDSGYGGYYFTSWTSSTLPNGDYLVMLSAYSDECDNWSTYAYAYISVS